MTTTKGKIPEKIKLGDKEYALKDHPELLGLVEVGRSAEKEKLNADIDQQKATIKDLKNKVESATGSTTKIEADLKEAKEALKNAEDEKAKVTGQLKQLEKMRSDGDNNEDKDSKKADSLSPDEVKKIVDEAIAKVQTQSNAQVEDLKKKLTASEAEAYRKEVIANHKDTVIPELLTGTTKEEIDESLSKAIEVSKRYLRSGDNDSADGDETEDGKDPKSKKGNDSEESKPPEEPKDTAPPDGGKSDPGDDADLLKRAKDMTPDEYAKNRDAILRAAKRVKYGQSVDN